MKRRTILATTSSLTLTGMAGCNGLFSCNPGDDELGDYPPSEVAEREEPVKISFRATVERIEEEGAVNLFSEIYRTRTVQERRND
jgi:hypothetical protein